MAWQYSPLALVLSIVTVILFLFTIFAWKRRHAPGILPVLILFAATTLWSAASAVALSSTDPGTTITMDQAAHPAIVILPVAYLLLALWYTEQDYRPSRLFLLLLLVIPALSVFLVLTNNFHNLYYTGVSSLAGPRNSLIWIFDRGPLFRITAAYAIVMVMAAFVLLMNRYRTVGTLFRTQIALILAAGLVPVIATLFYYFDLGPEAGFDWTPVTFVISGFVLLAAILNYELLSLQPMTHSLLVRTMRDGAVASTADGRITLINPAGSAIFGISEDQAIGQSLAGLVPGLDQLLPPDGGKTPEETEITLQVDNIPRIFAVQTVPTPSDREHRGGCIFIFRDITDRKNAENAFMNANRKLNLLASIIRHDIRNKLTAIFIYVGLALEGDSKENMEQDLSRIRDSAEGIQSLIGFTQGYQDLGVAAPSWQSPNEALLAAGRILDCSGVRLVDETYGLEILADPLFERVIYNLLDNALRYAKGMTTFSLKCRGDGGVLLLFVEDDGPGIPLSDKERIFDKGFGHNTGLGLFLTREILGITGITIRETGEPGKGACFELTVPGGAYRFPSLKKE
jgi:PAS domain S-box-containing protein